MTITIDEKLVQLRSEIETKIDAEQILELCAHCQCPFEYKRAGLFELQWLLNEAENREVFK